MTISAPSIVTAASVREYMGLNTVSAESKYSDATIGSNIKAAGWYLERATGRRFADRTETLKFTTEGRAWVPIPGLRTATSVTSNGSALTADSTYWLIPDAQQTGVYTGIQLRAFQSRSGGPSYLHNPQWFDLNLDSPWHPANRGGASSAPNDLSIAGDWGYTVMPDPVLHATKVLAAFYTKRPDALLSGAITTETSIFDLSMAPLEVRSFIDEWKVGSFVTGLA